MTRTQLIAQQLRDAGLPVGSPIEPDFDTDGEVKLANNYSVQVGSEYLILNQYTYRDGELFSVKRIMETVEVEQIAKYFK